MENGEYKNIEPQFNDKQLFIGLARLLIKYGAIRQPGDPQHAEFSRGEEEGPSFFLRGILPLTEAGVEQIEFVPEYMFDGEMTSNTIFVIFNDPEIDKTAVISDDAVTDEVTVDVMIESKLHITPHVTEEGLRATLQAMDNLFSGKERSDDPLVAEYEDKIQFMLSEDLSPTPEDMLVIEDAYRRLEQWFAARLGRS